MQSFTLLHLFAVVTYAGVIAFLFSIVDAKLITFFVQLKLIIVGFCFRKTNLELSQLLAVVGVICVLPVLPRFNLEPMPGYLVLTLVGLVVLIVVNAFSADNVDR